MKKRFIGIALLLAATLTASATQVKVKTAKGDVSVTFMSSDIVRIHKTNNNVTNPAQPSLVVVMKEGDVKLRETADDGYRTFKSGKLAVIVSEKTGRVSFESIGGTELLKEGDWDLTAINDGLDKGCAKSSANFQLGKDEAIYGIGLMENGKLNQRGENRRMMQTNLEDFQNVIQSIKGYALYWDNYSPTQINDTPEAGLTLASEVSEGIDYYFMYGGSGDGNVALIRQLTGDVPMLPLYSYGFWQSRERYKSQKELTEVVDKYRATGVPLDGIVQDWQYWGDNYTWNAMEFINPEFYDAKAMIDHVHQQKAHLAVSIWQSFGPMTKPYKDMEAKGYLFDFKTWPESGLTQWPPRKDYPSGVRVYKPYNEEARDIYWQHLKRLYDLGTDVWWMDSTDPDHNDYKDSDLDAPTALGSFRRVRNAFPLECVRGVYEHQRKANPDKRVMIYTRSGFAGQQRFASDVWTGDVASNWPTLRNQLPMTLNFSLTGNPHVNTDIGGFFSGAYNKGYDPTSAGRNPQYQELYVRWMQFGAFCPMMRSHGCESYRELYYYGEKGQPVYDALLDAVNLRYRLLPYIYSTAWDVTHRQGTFMRALWLDFASDSRVQNMTDEFMFGRQLLVAPIVQAQYTPEKLNKEGIASPDFMATKQTTKYLPKGATWYDFATGKRYEGGQDVTLSTTLKSIPLFVRAGSILPMGKEMQCVAERDWSQMELRVYPGANGSFTLYEDDGETYGYEKGQYAEIALTWDDKAQTLTIGARKGSYEGMLTARKFTVVKPDGTQKTVDYKGKKLKVKL